MKALSLLFLPTLGLLVWGKSLCPVDEAINEKIRDVASFLIPQVIRNIGLECRSVTSRGDLVTCPSGEYRTCCLDSRFCSQYPITPSPMSSLYFSRTTSPCLYFPNVLVLSISGGTHPATPSPVFFSNFWTPFPQDTCVHAPSRQLPHHPRIWLQFPGPPRPAASGSGSKVLLPHSHLQALLSLGARVAPPVALGTCALRPPATASALA
uniref:Resistin n=1 Tax=Sus scrofa TaxID=9823 RepID=A0A8D0PLF8_PIG